MRLRSRAVNQALRNTLEDFARRRRPIEPAAQTEWTIAEDKTGRPVLIVSERAPTNSIGETYLDVYAYFTPDSVSMKLMASVHGRAAELIDITPSRDVNRGVGSALLSVGELALRQMGAERVSGELSPVDREHRDRQAHFYKKHGYAVSPGTGPGAGRVAKVL